MERCDICAAQMFAGWVMFIKNQSIDSAVWMNSSGVSTIQIHVDAVKCLLKVIITTIVIDRCPFDELDVRWMDDV